MPVVRCLDKLVLRKFKGLSDNGRVTVSGSVDRETSVNGRIQYTGDIGNERSVGQSSKNDTNRPKEGNVLCIILTKHTLSHQLSIATTVLHITTAC